jgi:hypothetical protein
MAKVANLAFQTFSLCCGQHKLWRTNTYPGGGGHLTKDLMAAMKKKEKKKKARLREAVST